MIHKIFTNRVFPVKRDKTRKPLVKWKDERNWLNDVDALAQFNLGHNLSFVIPNGLVVLDIDYKYGGRESYLRLMRDYKIPPASTLTITSGNGCHLYYVSYCPEHASAVEGHKGIEIKKSGMCIDIPPSIHRNGLPYKVIVNKKPIPLPKSIYHLTIKKQVKPKPKYFNQREEDVCLSDCALQANLDNLYPQDFVEYERFFAILSACSHASKGRASALQVFQAWASKDPSYSKIHHANEITASWQMCSGGGTHYTVATLFYFVKQSGQGIIRD